MVENQMLGEDSLTNKHTLYKSISRFSVGHAQWDVRILWKKMWHVWLSWFVELGISSEDI